MQGFIVWDLDSAHAIVTGTLIPLHPYKGRDLQRASRVYDAAALSYQNRGVFLIDFLSGQARDRSVQGNCLGWVASYLSAGNQFNLALGREVIP